MLLRLVMNDLDEYVGGIFEDISRQFLLRTVGELPLKPTKVGRWWRGGEEVDIVLLDEIEKRALLVEVKWKGLRKREAWRVLEELARKSELIGLEGWELKLGLIAKEVKSKEELREFALVWDLKDMGEVT